MKCIKCKYYYKGYNTIIEWLKDSPNDIEITSVIQLMEDENMLYDKELKQTWYESTDCR